MHKIQICSIVFANPAYETLSGYSTEELTGSAFRLAKRESDGQQELERLKAAIGRAEACAVTVPDLRKDGTSWISEISVEPIYNARGDLKYFLCIQKPARERGGESSNVEVSLLERELGRARQKIANLDRVDPATGLTAARVLSGLAATRSGRCAPRSTLHHGAAVRDRRLRGLSTNIRLEGGRLLSAHDRRAGHAHAAARRRSLRALRRLDARRVSARSRASRGAAVGRPDYRQRATPRAAQSALEIGPLRDDSQRGRRLPAGRGGGHRLRDRACPSRPASSGRASRSGRF